MYFSRNEKLKIQAWKHQHNTFENKFTNKVLAHLNKQEQQSPTDNTNKNTEF